jgi:hypothetical protein
MSLVPSRRARRLLASAGWLAALALTGFHGLLLWTRIAQGELVEPPVAARWIATGLVLAGFRALHRRGFSVVGGRRAVALWLIVILLHVQVASTKAPAVGDDGSPPGHVASAVLVTGAVSLAGLALFVLVAAGAASTPRRPSPRPARAVGPRHASGVRRLARALHVVPRPPPHASAHAVSA